MSHYRAEAIFSDGCPETHERVPLGVFSSLNAATSKIKEHSESKHNYKEYWYYSVCKEIVDENEYEYADVIVSPKLLIGGWEKWEFGKSVD